MVNATMDTISISIVATRYVDALGRSRQKIGIMDLVGGDNF